ncbi:alpha/beta fold hydrolase [Streptomyces sp. SID13031]|uniref:alpha/beta fold hydrolase n=1 Tax=Streptomyces sp. SID13031 TaxID=2706046 RepID=UPI0013CC302A|nr:alpha/beta fold hydrolase [Streptomyces sp. SID13031]NEA34387.1 alpha/beta fold hydrolase [Streptomyces sp. SID13031]
MSATATVTVAGVPGVEIAYDRKGAGTPLLLLHGIGHHRQAFDPVIGQLAESRDVIALDFPGFGESPDVPAGIPDELDSFALAVEAFCTALDLGKPDVVGNSMGGLVALRLGQLGSVRSVTALSPAGFWTPRERTWALNVLVNMRRVAQHTPDSTIRRMARTTSGRRVMTGMIYHRPAQRSPEAVVAETLAMRASTAFDRVVRLGKSGVSFDGDVPDVPVTIAWGTHDRILLPRQAARAHLQLPGARMIPLYGCGHVPMNDDSALVARTILNGSA